MMTKASKKGAVAREVGERRVLELIDEVQERLTLIRKLAEYQIENAKSSNGTTNGVTHA